MRDKSLTKPSGLTGDTKPYPLKPWEWTADEFRLFLIQHNYPACTFRDRQAGHERAVIDAIYRDIPVPAEVLADFPEAAEAAASKKRADTAWTEAYESRMKQVEAFRQSPDYQKIEQDMLGIFRSLAAQYRLVQHEDYSGAPCRWRADFDLNGVEYYAILIEIPARWCRFGKIQDASRHWAVWHGRHPYSSAWEPLARIPVGSDPFELARPSAA